MADFTAGGIHELPVRARSIGDAAFDRRIAELVRDWGGASPELIRGLIVTALKMGRDELEVADLKLFNRALRELRRAARMFGPYAERRKVVVFGSARTPRETPEWEQARDFGQKMREQDYMVITGGGGGIMAAAQEGAGRENSFGLNIRLPFEQQANETIHGDSKLVTFNYFFTRKLNFVKETHAVALFPGGFGTMDEGFEVLTLMQTGKARIMPFIFIDKPGGDYWQTFLDFLQKHLLMHGLVSPGDFNFFKITTSVDEAVAEIAQFYRIFHNYRWVGERMVIRLLQPLTAAALAGLNRDFADILSAGSIEPSAALPEEGNQPQLLELPRLVLTPNRRHFGRLRALIDAINRAETEAR